MLQVRSPLNNLYPKFSFKNEVYPNVHFTLFFLHFVNFEIYLENGKIYILFNTLQEIVAYQHSKILGLRGIFSC